MTKSNVTFDQFCKAVDQHLADNPNDKDVKKAKSILSNTANFLTSKHLVRAGEMSGSLESLEHAPKLNTEINIADGSDVREGVEQFLIDCGIDKKNNPVRFTSMVKQIGRALAGENTSPSHFSADRDDASRMSLDRVTSASAYAAFRADERTAMEAFGADIDRVQPDVRLNIALTVMKSYKSLIDRVIARIPAADNVLTIKIPENEIYDLEKSAAATSAERWQGSHRQPMINLYRKPDPASTAPKKVVPLSANDTGTPSVMLGDALKTGMKANLFDLSMDSNRVGFDHVDHTDLISEGGRVAALYVQAVWDNGVDPAETEVFKIPVSYVAGARFTQVGNTTDSGDRAAMIKTQTSALTQGVETAAGAASVIFDATFAADTLQLAIDFNASINLKSGDVQGSGSVVKKAVVTGTGAASGGAAATRAGQITVTVISYDLDVYYSEENVRKSTVAVRQNFRNQTFEIPVGRTAIVDVSLQQSTPEAALDAVATVNALGNTARALDVFQGHMDDVFDRNAQEDAHTEVGFLHSISREYAAGSLVLPRVIKETLDLDDDADAIAIMRESEKLTELHARVRARLLAIVAQLNTKSLYHTALEPGETPVFKIIAHSVLVDLLFGIEDYHNPLNDEPNGGRKQAGSDYSMLLPNGTRVDIYKTDFDAYKNKFIGFVVREKDAEDVTSFAAIRDRGTFVGNYTLTNASAANKRFITNSREIPFVTCPVAFDVAVTNLTTFFPSLDI